jgi:hypothetical protein
LHPIPPSPCLEKIELATQLALQAICSEPQSANAFVQNSAKQPSPKIIERMPNLPFVEM